MLLGCAVFYDILKPVAVLSKALQEQDLCTIRAIDAVLKAKDALVKLKTTAFEDMPTVKKVLSRVQTEDSGNRTYQSTELKEHDRSVEFLRSNYAKWTSSMLECFRNCLISQEDDLLLVQQAITILATNGWERTTDVSFGHAVLEHVCRRFSSPLEGVGVDVACVLDEWDDVIAYAKAYLDLVRNEYKVVWWKLFNCTDAVKWSNLFKVVELLFCLPVANGHLERVFSQLKLIKTNRRTCLAEDTLDQLMRINAEGPPLASWNPDRAIGLWWADKHRSNKGITDKIKATFIQFCQL